METIWSQYFYFSNCEQIWNSIYTQKVIINKIIKIAEHSDSNVELDHRSEFDITVTFITVEEIFGYIQYIAVNPRQKTSHVLNTIKYLNKKNIHTLHFIETVRPRPTSMFLFSLL